MKKLINFIKASRDTALLSGALLALIIALFHPKIPVKHNIYTYLLVADISQSMNVKDVMQNGKEVTRLEHTKKLMHEILSSLPCGTKVSIGLFAGVSVAALYQPIEVCTNFAALNDTVDHFDWRMGWSGNSRVRESLYSAARTIRGFPEPAQMVILTDGEEAPKLHIFNTKELKDFQGGDGWLFVGIGSEKGAAIPKLSDKNQLIGYWSNESFAVQPGIAQISESNIGMRDNSVANGANDRYISKLNSEYLKSLSKEIGGSYVHGDNVHTILDAMKNQKPARRDVAPFDLHWVLATLAGILLLSAYINKNSFRDIKQSLNLYKNALKRRTSKNTTKIAHDNQLMP